MNCHNHQRRWDHSTRLVSEHLVSILVTRSRRPVMKRIFARIRKRRPLSPSPSTTSFSTPQPLPAGPARTAAPNSASDSKIDPSGDASASANTPSAINDAEPAPSQPVSAVVSNTTSDSETAAPQGANIVVTSSTALDDAESTAIEPAGAEPSVGASDSKTSSAPSVSVAARRPVPQKPSGAFFEGVKLFFKGLEAGLTGIGVPGVEAIAKVPLWIINCCEVRMGSFRDLRLFDRLMISSRRLKSYRAPYQPSPPTFERSTPF